MTECKKNSDEKRLIREGTTQEDRFPPALDPAYAPVDDWEIEHGILFAKAYAKFLKYYDAGNREAGDWQPFFGKDVSALLAVMAMQDIAKCRDNIRNHINELDDLSKRKKALGKIINCIGIIAKQIDILKEGLTDEYPLKAILSNLVRNRLDDDFKEVILCCRDCFGTDASSLKECNPSFKVIRSESCTDIFTLLEGYMFSVDWIPGTKTPEDKNRTWIEYLRELYAQSEKSSLSTDEKGINKLSELSNRFLMAYARTVTEARRSFEDSLKKWNRHEPHYALFLAFLRLMKHARNELNTLTGRHLDFYYREILQFKEKEVVPPKAHVLVELAKQVPSYLIKAGEEFKAGKDDLGKDVFFVSERDFVANRAKVAELKTVFRYQPNKEEFDILPEPTDKNIVSKKDAGRIYASSVANSEDGQGGELISEDESWHPFFNKKYENGKISEIKMPKAEIGFAIASHYLWMDGGDRTVTLNFTNTNGTCLGVDLLQKKGILCFFTGAEGWIAGELINLEKNALHVNLSGSKPPVVPYSSKIHKDYFKTNLNLKTDLPVLLIKLNQNDTEEYLYDNLNDLNFKGILLQVEVKDFKPLIISNDFGPIDTSKPFQPFGASPVKQSALVIGLKEIFQKKKIEYIKAKVIWQQSLIKKDFFDIEYLQDGSWHGLTQNENVSGEQQEQDGNVEIIPLFGVALKPQSPLPYIEEYNFFKQEYITSLSNNGFVRIKINNSFDQEKIDKKEIDDCLTITELDKKIACLMNLTGKRAKPPIVHEITIDYQTTAKEIEIPQISFFHVSPFGCTEQYLKNSDPSNKGISLLPQLALPPEKKDDAPEKDAIPEAAEFYIGITDLKPPQNLSLLFQVADGTANPEKEKPKYPHIHWSYLRNNEWIPFLSNAVEDSTDELITSGIITFAVPRDASDDNTLLPAGMHWIRAAVSSDPDAVCRLRMVEAQAVKIKFVDKENDPNFSAKTLLKDSITKLARPAAEVKKITQPFPSYGGRGKESSKAFYTRVSERLRHKDRAITLWDYERLILEAFPEVHKVKCLNHTSYEYGKKDNKCVLNENAPGHVTIVTIANQEHHSLPDRLRPNVSLGLHEKIKEFFRPKLSSFVELHVVNPKFEEVKVDFRVKLHQGYDETYYINLLREAIVRFLSPWAFSGNGSPSFGGKIYKSALINFAEEQDYVDYLTDFQLFVDGGKDIETAEGSDAISILTSAHVSKHIIQITND